MVEENLVGGILLEAGGADSSLTDVRGEQPQPPPGTEPEVREFCKLLARILRRIGSDSKGGHEPRAE